MAPVRTRRYGEEVHIKPTLTAILLLGYCAGCPGDEIPDPESCSTDPDCSHLDTDGNACNGTFACQAGACVAVDDPVVCSDTGDCQVATCVPETGQCETSPAPDGQTCDDGDKCTVDKVCQTGECSGGSPTCTTVPGTCTIAMCDAESGECGEEQAADFADCDDNDACTVNDTCLQGACSGGPKSCEDDDNPCTAASCTQGECGQSPGNEGESCEDGDPCTEADVCGGGVCVSGQPKCIDGGGPCEVSSCATGTGECQTEPKEDGVACDDNDACTLAETCTAGVCGSGSPKCGDNANPCLDFDCEAGSGECLPVPTDGSPPCDDDDVCTTSDHCISGLCLGTTVTCAQDDNPCTASVCGAGGACEQVVEPDGAPCPDADPCTVSESCSAGQCKSLPKCPDDGNSCTIETCSGATGVCAAQDVANGGACDDGNPCTEGETCAELVCADGEPFDCPDDSDPCTAALCLEEDGGCVNVLLPDGAACEDGEPCTTGEACTVDGACLGGAETVCEDDGSPCTQESCVTGEGCVSVNFANGAPCDDGSACTSTDTCQSGSCVGVVQPCVPDSPCKVADCDSQLGCQQQLLPDDVECDDGNPCTSDTVCLAGQCTGGSTMDCSQPGNPCLISVCSASSGACETQNANAGTNCDDGDPCTTGDGCEGGECEAGDPLDCGFADNACLALLCNSQTGGCDPKPLAEGAACNVGNPCVGEGICQNGVCSGKPIMVCDAPDDPCLISACDPNLGACVDNSAPAGAACKDDDPCTQDTSCQAGVCKGGTPVQCPDDGDTCTLEVCTSGVGCASVSEEDGVPCGDGDPCTEETTCTNGQCSGGLTQQCPVDGNECTSDTCITGSGCTYPPLGDGGQCNDGSACTAGDACSAGECQGTPAVSCEAPDDPCLASLCNAQTGACETIAAEDGTVCNDENVCTTGDVCSGGSCVGSAQACEQNDDPCTTHQCDPGPGACVAVPSSLGTPCNDGLVCTVDDGCDGAGACSGAPKACPAADQACQEAACDPANGQCLIVVSGNGTPCEDSDKCSTGDFCLQGTCAPGTQPACAPKACAEVSCEPTTGVCSEAPLGDGTSCNDGDACTTGETCGGGNCSGGLPVLCEQDDNACTLAECNALSGACESAPTPAGSTCNDENPCTEADACDGGACVGTELSCDPSSNPCAISECLVDQGGCVEVAVTDLTPCEDGQLCSTDGKCMEGECESVAVECPAPPTDCQQSVCKPGIGCVSEDASEGNPCFDNVCLVGSTCLAGVCAGGEDLACTQPDEPCLSAVCDGETGCQSAPIADGGECEDGDQCTEGSECFAGACEGTEVDCPEPGLCQVAVCDPDSGCGVKPASVGTGCDDGDKCTTGDICDAVGECSGSVVECTGGSTCAPELCDAANGVCVPMAVDDGLDCDDGNACTTASICTAGSCGGGDNVTCEQPADACLVAVCSPSAGGCTNIPTASGTPCNDENLCTTGDQCEDGTCAGELAVLCGEPSGCVFATCDPDTGGCDFALGPDDAPCDDGDVCTQGDICSAGGCVAGAASADCCSADGDCDDGTVCTADACVLGRCAFTAVDLPACLVRVVVAGQSDGELTILDGATLEEIEGSPVTVSGSLQLLAGSNQAQAVFAAMKGGLEGVLGIDPFQPDETIPAPPAALDSVQWVAVDDVNGLLVVIHPDGSVETYDLQTAGLLSSGAQVPTPTGRPAIDSSQGRLYVPSEQGLLAMVLLGDPLVQPPTTPWFVGGAPNAAAHDAVGERIFLADSIADGVRVVHAHSGAGQPGDTLTGFSDPSGVAVETRSERLFVTYPEDGVLRVFELDTLTPAGPAIAIPVGDSFVSVDSIGGRAYVTETASGKLHVFDSETLAPVSGSPASVAADPVDVVIVRSRPGALVLSEAMINPSAVDDADGEWFEVHNPGTTPVSLDGWTLTSDVAFFTFGASAPTVAPGGFAVLCRNSNVAENGGVNCSGSYSGVPLTNTGTNLFLTDPQGRPVDHAGLAAPIPTGKSLALRHAGYNNARRYSWSDSNGTPGAANADVADAL